MVKKSTRLRHQELKKVFQYPICPIVWHNPHTHAWERLAHGGIENGSHGIGSVRHALVSEFNECIVYRLPTRADTHVGIQNNTYDVAFISRSELNWNSPKQPLYATVWLYLVEVRNSTVTT